MEELLLSLFIQKQLFILVTFPLLLDCIKGLILQNIKFCIFSALVLSGMIRFLKYDQSTLYNELSQFFFTRRADHPTPGPKN